MALAATLLIPTSTACGAEYHVYLGSYTGAKSKGIYVARFDPKTGSLSAPELAAEIPSPSFLALHPKRPWLYAVNEVGSFGGKPSGSVSAFTVDAKSGKLTPINQQSSGGSGPCHLTVDAAGRNVLVANYGGGSVAVLPIREDGSLGEPTAVVQHKGSSVNPERQKEPHAHSINLDAANRFAFAADLGLDKIMVYKFDVEAGTLVPNRPSFAAVKPGAGPRHFAFHPSGKFAFVINELQCTVTAFSYNAKEGFLQELQTISTLPPTSSVERGFSTAEIVAHPSGQFLYGSNRGHDSIVVYSVNPRSGRLSYVENASTQGKTPRNFNIDPTGGYLFAANQGSDSVVVFRIDTATGKLTPTGTTIEVGTPVCIRFLKAR